jgi:heme oxygenase
MSRPPSLQAPLSALAALREATWTCHQRLEKRIDFKSRVASREAYRAHLVQMWGFYAALEPRLATSLGEAALADFEARRKLPLLERDLLALGADVSLLPRCAAVPSCDDAASALGAAYVLEGATLGGRTLMPLVESRLGLTPERGAAFFSSYGAAVDSMWRAFGAVLERCCPAGPERVRAAASAAATFAALEGWLCGAAA